MRPKIYLLPLYILRISHGYSLCYCQKGELPCAENVKNAQNVVVIELVYTQHVPKRNGTSYQHAGQVGNIRQGAEQGRAAAAARL